MLDFRPHKIQSITFISGGTDEYGMPIADQETTEDIECLIVSDSQAESQRFLDGISFNYNYLIYLNQDCRQFEIGERVKLFGLDGEIEHDKEFKVKGFFRHQMNAHLWV